MWNGVAPLGKHSPLSRQVKLSTTIKINASNFLFRFLFYGTATYQSYERGPQKPEPTAGIGNKAPAVMSSVQWEQLRRWLSGACSSILVRSARKSDVVNFSAAKDWSVDNISQISLNTALTPRCGPLIRQSQSWAREESWWTPINSTELSRFDQRAAAAVSNLHLCCAYVYKTSPLMAT